MLGAHRIRIDVVSSRKEILRAINAINNAGKGASADDVIGRINCSRMTFYRHIRYLLDDGFVIVQVMQTRGRPAKYFITVEGKKVVETPV